jgi:hypothetical protein
MTQWLGDYKEDETVYFLWSTNDRSGASVTRTVDGTVSVYKDNGVAQSVAGITDTEDFDGLTGIHACTIDLSADAFYAVGADYAVVLSAATIDGQTVNAVLAHFSIENRFQEVDVVKWLGQACAAVSQAGVPEVDLTHIAGAAVDTASAQLGTNVIQIEGVDATDQIRDAILDDATRFSGANIDQALSTTESNIRGADSDTLKTLSDQIDAISADNIWDEVMDTNAPAACNTARHVMNLAAAFYAGRDAGTGDWSALSLGGNKTRIQATLSSSGARTSVDTVDGT